MDHLVSLAKRAGNNALEKNPVSLSLHQVTLETQCTNPVVRQFPSARREH